MMATKIRSFEHGGVQMVSDLPGRYLFPAEIFVSSAPVLISTILGSCVAVCLWDSRAAIGGMNHYLLPLWNGDGLATPKYGNIAIRQLVEKVVAKGGERKNIQAKIFGGAAMWSTTDGLFAIGLRNVALAEQQLQELQIPLVASDVGGTQSRKIFFNTGDGSVLLRRQRS
jgi:chemotaxis protein CheD